MNYNGLFGGSGGSSGSLSFSLHFTQSGVWTAPFACDVVIAGVGAGGGGGGGSYALGGNSAPWGLKRISVAAGQTLTMTNGAGGAGGTGAAGSPGGSSTVALSGTGTILTIGGGEGGIYSASAIILNPATVVSAVTGADAWFAGLQAGATTSAVLARVGGAAVNLGCDGSGRSPGLTAGGATAGGSVGITPVANATTAVTPMPISNFVLFGLIPSGTPPLGKGSSATTSAAADAFGGGGGHGAGVGGAGGYGGGGGGGNPTGGAGGGAYFTLFVVPSA